NNKIKVIKRTAYGFRNFFNFRIRILLALPNTYIAINWRNHNHPSNGWFAHRL
ncbi:transposase, partial [Limosilactobacillus reuteri]|uniref:transposase n=1 Tax=Limosilactobacillus reuteri TaxID=1598 RepID=UPI001E4257D6